MTEDYTKNINADAKTVQKDNDKKSISKSGGKLKSAVVKDTISQRGRTAGGGRPDDIIINPPLKIMEASERHAVVAFGRMNPPTTGHEKLIHKVEDTAKEAGGEAHIIATHTEGNPKNPLPAKAKVGYIKKFVKPDTKVVSSSKDSPTLLHQLSNLHNSGVKHVTMVAGSDRVKEFHDLIHKYNGKEGPHGHYNFKSIKVVSAGGRDPDAEGTTGISGTKMREYAHAGDEKKFKSGLPKALHPHAKEIMGHITKTNESFNSAFELLADHSLDIIKESFKEIAEDITDITEKQFRAIKEKSIKSGVNLDRLIEEYKFAYVLYQCAPHDNMTAEQWSFAAVNSLIANESKDAPWNHEAPSDKHSKLSPAQKAKAKARAKAAGRPYPNWVDNVWAVNEEAVVNNATAGGVRGLGNVTGNPDGESSDYIQANIVDADTMDNKFKELNAAHVAMHDRVVIDQKNAHIELHDKSTVKEDATFTDLGVPATVKLPLKKKLETKEAIDKNNPDSRLDASDSLVSVYTKDTPGQKNKKVAVKEVSNELIGRVNTLRRLGPDISKGIPPTPHKTTKGAETLAKAVDRVRYKSNVGAPPMKESADKFGKVREVISRHGQKRKEMDLVPRNGEDRKTDDRFYRQQSIVKNVIEDNEYQTPVTKEKLKSPEHFSAINDIALNTKNRNLTIKEYSYGPIDPNDEKNNIEFWNNKAFMWNSTVEAAKQARCGNCAAFNQSPKVIKMIDDAIGENGQKIQKMANLGFCELFEFKCAAARTCDAWIMNGPLKENIESIDELSKEKLKAYTTDANKQIMSRKLPLKKEINREKSVYTAQKKIMKKIWNEAKDKSENINTEFEDFIK